VEERTVEQIIASAAAAARTALSEIESKQLLQALGVAVTIPQAALNADEAVAAAARIGFPVVLKVLSPEVSHKSEVGGVALGLSSEREVRDAFARIRASLAERAPGARFDGVAVERMARPGVELILGIIRDERFGPLVIAGLGGIFVEVFADTAFRLAPIDRREARAMLDELRGGAILRRVRTGKGGGRRFGGCFLLRRGQKDNIEDLLADKRQRQIELRCDCGCAQSLRDEHPARQAARE